MRLKPTTVLKQLKQCAARRDRVPQSARPLDQNRPVRRAWLLKNPPFYTAHTNLLLTCSSYIIIKESKNRQANKGPTFHVGLLGYLEVFNFARSACATAGGTACGSSTPKAHASRTAVELTKRNWGSAGKRTLCKSGNKSLLAYA